MCDTGVGMTAEQLEHAIEPFYTTKQDNQGNGLGLSMVYGFSKQSGGDLVIESQPDRGTIVRLLIPRHLVGSGETVSSSVLVDSVADNQKQAGAS